MVWVGVWESGGHGQVEGGEGVEDKEEEGKKEEKEDRGEKEEDLVQPIEPRVWTTNAAFLSLGLYKPFDSFLWEWGQVPFPLKEF